MFHLAAKVFGRPPLSKEDFGVEIAKTEICGMPKVMLRTGGMGWFGTGQVNSSEVYIWAHPHIDDWETRVTYCPVKRRWHYEAKTVAGSVQRGDGWTLDEAKEAIK